MNSGKTDMDLVLEFTKNKDQQAFEEIIKRHEDKMYSIALRYTKHQEDAEEVIQEVCITLYNKLENFKGESAFTSWLYRVVANAALMKLRKNRQDKSTPVEDLKPFYKHDYYSKSCEDVSRADERSMQHQTREMIETAVNKLADEYKEVFILRDVNGYSNEEVSAELDISVSAVKSRLHRARLMLRKKLSTYWEDYKGVSQMDQFQMAVNG